MSEFMSLYNSRNLVKQKNFLKTQKTYHVQIISSPTPYKVFKIVQSLKRESLIFTNLQQ